MKIIVLLSACFVGFNLACQDAATASEVATTQKIVYVTPEEPVATIALDTIEVVYEAPAPLAATGL
ncbi:MAG TPA: hypothetical protein VIG72_09220 [Pontibacter sp.]